MKPGRFDLDIYRGDSYEWQLTLWEDSTRTQPVDLTGVVAAAQVRTVYGGPIIASMTLVISLPNIITMSLDTDSSADCPPKGVWDLQLTYDDGRVRTVLTGNVVTTPDVTEP